LLTGIKCGVAVCCVNAENELTARVFFAKEGFLSSSLNLLARIVTAQPETEKSRNVCAQ